MGNTIAALNANAVVVANAASNLANLNTQGYQSIRTTVVQGSNGDPTVVTSRDKTLGTPTEDGQVSSNVEIPREVSGMMLAQRGYEAALGAVKKRDDMLKDLMDIFDARQDG